MLRYKFMQNKYNIYRSVAYLNGMPMHSFNPYIKKEQQMFMVQYFKDYVVDYDLVFDFDTHFELEAEKDDKMVIATLKELNIDYDVVSKKNKNIYNISKEDKFKIAYNEAKEFKKEILDYYKVPYSLKISGSGIHFEIEGKYANSVEDNPLQKVKVFGMFANDIKTIFSFYSLDLSIYDLRRIWKVAYSYDIKTGNIALPLTDEQFNHFSFDMVKPDNIGDVRNRGLLVRYANQDNYLEMQENTKQMFDEILYDKEPK